MAEVAERPIDITVLGHHIKSEADLQGLGGSDLVAIHNHCADAPTNRFADKQSAVRRTWAAVQKYAAESGQFEATPEELEAQATRKEVKAAKAPLELDEPAPEPKVSKPKKAKAEGESEGETRGRPRGFSFRFPLGRDGAKPPKEGSKRFQVLQLLLRPKGATFDEVQEVSGWKRTDAYEGIRLLHFANGYRLWQSEDGRIHASGDKA